MKWEWSIYKWWNESDLKEDGSTKRTHPQQTYNDDNDKDCSSQQTNIPIISGERVWCYFRQQTGSQDLQCNRRQTICVEIPQCNEDINLSEEDTRSWFPNVDKAILIAFLLLSTSYANGPLLFSAWLLVQSPRPWNNSVPLKTILPGVAKK